MKIRILIVLIISLTSSCAQPRVQEEMFDFITTTIYHNNYDTTGRLSFVNVVENTEENVDGKYILTDAIHTVQKYKYSIDGIHEISTISDRFPNSIYIIKNGEKSYEDYSIENGSDTVYYNFSIYLDKDKSKLQYNRSIGKSIDFSEGHYEKNENTESNYYYDNRGNNTKIIKRNFITGDLIETYIFYNIPYKEAVKLASKRENVEIVCCNEKERGDTTITYYQINGKTTYYTKKYKDGDKTIEARFDADSLLVEQNTNYKQNELDITVKQVSELKLIDSIYHIAGKEIRRVSVYPDSKSITISKYDVKGNIVKEVRKSKVSVTKEDINELFRLIQESKKE